MFLPFYPLRFLYAFYNSPGALLLYFILLSLTFGFFFTIRCPLLHYYPSTVFAQYIIDTLSSLELLRLRYLP